MASDTTIPGGAYKDSSGNWVDANGRPLTSEQAAEAERTLLGKQPEPETKPELKPNLQPEQPEQRVARR